MSARGSLLGDIVSTIIFQSVIPGSLFILYLNDIILYNTFKIGTLICFIIFFIGPLVFKFSYSLQRQVIFLNYVNLPKNPNYSNPEEYGLNGTRNFKISTEDKVLLGVWHILPNSLIKSSLLDQDFEVALKHGEPVFIYCHGNSGNRAADHRIELYKLLRVHHHVIAFDYRGYGDSSSLNPTETGAVIDAIAVIQWVRNMTNSKIFIWGHSLGTGIASHALAVLSKERITIDGLILESPFNSIRSEVSEHPSAYLFKNLPWFKFTVVDPLYDSGFRFETDKHILNIDCPILILHAEDDLVIPFKIGFKLYTTASENRTKNQGPILFQRFERKFGYGHKYICRAPELPNIIDKFVKKSIQSN